MSLTPGPSIFIDESGDPGLSQGSIQRRPYFTLGYVYLEDNRLLRKKLRRLLKRMHQRGKYPPHLCELKFYIPYTDLIQQGYTIQQLDKFNGFMPTLRSKAIDIICRAGARVFAAVVDKRRAYAGWKPDRLYNFVFAQTLLINVLNELSPPSPPNIFFDRGHLSPAKTASFKVYLLNKDSYFQLFGIKRFRGSLGLPNDVPSYLEPSLWAADILAGAFYHKHAHNDWAYANLFTANLIGQGERIFWR